MTSEQKKAIDACKDQAARDISKLFPLIKYPDYHVAQFHASAETLDRIFDRAMQLYGEQCSPKWTKVIDGLPKKPGRRDYEHVRCLVFVPAWGQMVLEWNCEHLCWDDESGDDVSTYNNQVTHWQELSHDPEN
jgi:hypothetical protein